MEKEKQGVFCYHSEYEGDVEVMLDIQRYQNGRIYIGLVSLDEDGHPEPFSNVTVNIDAPILDYCGYLDTNDLSNVEKFIVENDLGTFTGIMGESGYCRYPLYMFNVEKLCSLYPDQMAEYIQGIS